MNTRSFQNLIDKYKNIDEQLKALQDQQRLIKDKLKLRLKESEVDSLETKEAKVSYYISERTYYPAQRLIKKFGEKALEDVKTVTKVEGLRVTFKKQEEDEL